MDERLDEMAGRWLRERGFTPVIIDEPSSTWHVRIDYPMRTQNTMHVFVPKQESDALGIAMGAEVSAEHVTSFEKLDEEAKEEFNWELRNRLLTPEVDFHIDGVTSGRECPTRFQVMSTRYADGLTKDSLTFTQGAVYKTWLEGIWYIQRQLGPSAPGTGGRFDFRRLGY